MLRTSSPSLPPRGMLRRLAPPGWGTPQATRTGIGGRDGLVVARVGDRRVDDLGDLVGVDPRVRAVCDRAGGGAARNSGTRAGQRLAEGAGGGDRARNCLVVLLVRGGGPG